MRRDFVPSLHPCEVPGINENMSRCEEKERECPCCFPGDVDTYVQSLGREAELEVECVAGAARIRDDRDRAAKPTPHAPSPRSERRRRFKYSPAWLCKWLPAHSCQLPDRRMSLCNVFGQVKKRLGMTLLSMLNRGGHA